MDDIDRLKQTVSDFQSAQLDICNAIVELLIENGVCSEQQAHTKFRSTAGDTAQSDAGLKGAEIVLMMCEFLEDKYPHLKVDQKPS
jgi:hypothetical protein